MTETERSRLIARIFSRPVLDDIARRGTAKHIAKRLAGLGVRPAKCDASVADLLDASLTELGQEFRCEYVYKAAIANRIVFGKHSPRTSSMSIELGVAGSIIDVAVFNGTSTAYEVKTEYDSYRRLNTQTPAYLRAFDNVYVVTHPDLSQRYATLVDERVGILCLTDKGSLREVRKPVRDISRIETAVIFRMLRRQEYMYAVHRHFGPQPAMPNGHLHQYYEQLFCRLTSQQAHKILVSTMRARTTDEDTVAFVSSLPQSLRVLGYETPLSRPKRQRLLDALAESI
ncbi:sce7726 family protein [Comamonas sp.]|uniref:sce7726 family protein n=1 Tax=Comamonas sp. TaxID=34028 RepID=UPI0028A2375F|nr:sce7726 family protein [Comamonas sp.]